MDFPRLNGSPLIWRDESDPSNVLLAKKIPIQNIASRLTNREIFGGFKPSRIGTEKYLQRSMYQSVFPNFTVTHVEKPPCFLRKFTPDGKLFVAFSQDQMSVEVYYFQGPQAANHLFVEWVRNWQSNEDAKAEWETGGGISSSSKASCPPPGKRPRLSSSNPPRGGCKSPYTPGGFPDVIAADEKDNISQDIRKNIFNAFFKLKFKVRAAPPGEDLNRECSLFTEDLRYLIVGSATYVHNQNNDSSNSSQPLSSHEIYRNNESVNPNTRFPLEDYSIHIIDLECGVLTDTKSFKSDRIFLSHNQGMYLYGNTLAILSVQHQTIYIFHVDNGQLWPVRTIGRFCYEDDELLYSEVRSFANMRPKDEAFFNTLKQRLLSYLYRRALDKAYGQDQGELEEDDEDDDEAFGELTDLSRLRQYHDQLVKLRIWKAQLLDEDHLLLKYSSEEVVTLRTTEPNSHHCLFVIYNMTKTEVVAVFENTTEELVDFFENFTDNFRNNNLTMEGRFISSPSNNMYSRQIHQKFRQTITSARYGGPVEATKRILAQLPISAQSFSPSPYLDQTLFSYDDHRVSAMERPKACGEIPIRFYGRDSGKYKFQIHAGILPRGSPASGRRLVAFTFHPTAPFAISVQRANAEYLVHFHIKLDHQSLLPLLPEKDSSISSNQDLL